ncbi:hypothetical protein [Gilliamella apicola]|uniref:Uncharacterized protein n=1 Tax=Gilliamella apicola TaxID=1196095 RepID=A0A2V4DQE1_9GAMM|nr:hypothetical protein [Gilliamella apicola]PXZ01425.1 hypothetical protein DKK79_14280 [Gilliamella apicola]
MENNGLSWADGGNGGNFIGIPYETGANLDSNLDAYAQGYLTEEEIIRLIDDMNSGRFMYDPLREDLKRFPEDLAILVTPYGDYIAFRDADNLGEYAIACVGILPIFKYIKIGGKIIKVETKSGLSLIKEAENAYKAGDITKGNQLMNQAVSHGTEVETTVIRQAHSSNAGKGTSGAGQAENAASELPALPPGKQGTVIKNALEPHEYQQALDIVKYKGGTFKGAEKANNPGIDGWLDGVPVQLKVVDGNSINAIRRNIVKGSNNMKDHGYKGDLYIDASKTGVSMKEMIDHFKPGSPVSNITKEGTVNNIYIKTQDGWLNVTGGSIKKGGSK